MAKGKPKVSKQEPKWRTVERVVGLLEATLDPGATVEHDVHLPDLVTPGVIRQCDVVVTTGSEYRRTRTIVEVQRRGRPVDISHFDAWVTKMRAVGAQHLICVSTVGFPSSVKAKAVQLGPTVRLVSLKELAKGSPLLQGSLGKLHLHQVGTKDFPSVELLVKDPAHLSLPGGKIMQHEPSFRAQTGELVSLNQIAQRVLNVDPRPNTLPDGIHALEFETDHSFVHISNETPGPVRLRFTANVEVHRARFDCEVLEYVQAPDEDPMAWVLLGETPRPDKSGTYQLQITFRTGTDGRLRPHAINVNGLEPGDIFSAVMGGMRAGPVLLK